MLDDPLVDARAVRRWKLRGRSEPFEQSRRVQHLLHETLLAKAVRSYDAVECRGQGLDSAANRGIRPDPAQHGCLCNRAR